MVFHNKLLWRLQSQFKYFLKLLFDRPVVILVATIEFFYSFEKLWVAQHLGMRRSSLFPHIRDWPCLKNLRYSSKIEELFLNNQIIVSVV